MKAVTDLPLITRDQALALLERAVAEKGADYVDPAVRPGNASACVYVKDGKPSCIVGHALYYHGYTSDDLEFFEDQLGAIDGWAGEWEEFVEHDAIGLFQSAQVCQDGGGTWGAALEVAKKRG